MYSTKGIDDKKAAADAKDRNKMANRKLYKPQKESGSWSWFFVKIVLFFVVVGGVYVGYTAWRSSNRSHRF